MSDDLAPLHVAILDEATVDQLFFDVGAAAELLEVVIKHGAEAYAEDGPPSLATARDALLSKRALGVQLRYRHESKEWWDTLLWTADGVRLVRMQR